MRLFLYVFRDYVKYVISTMVLCLFLFILFDFIHRTTKYFSDYKPSALLVAKMYLFQMPTFAIQAMPIAGLLASVVTMVMLSRSNEISAMRAAGMGPFQIGLPLGFGGLMLSLLSIILGELVLPKASSELHHVQEVLIEGGNERELAASARWQRRGNVIIHFRDFDHITQRLLGLDMMEVNPVFRPVRSIAALNAQYSPESGLWDAQDILITYFNPNGTIEYTEKRKSLTLKLNVDPKRLTRDRRKTDELGIGELRDLISKGEKSGVDTLEYRVDLQVKLAYPLAAFVVSLIGLNFGYRSERTTETARSILLAFGIGISYWFILNSFKAIGKRGDIPPFIAGWFANFFIFGVVVFQTWRGRKD